MDKYLRSDFLAARSATALKVVLCAFALVVAASFAHASPLTQPSQASFGPTSATGMAEPRDEEQVLRFGMSTALSGPARALGENMRLGVLAGFERANRSGGVHGRRLELIALDDGYEPERTAKAMRQLIAEDKVLAVIGNVGTPTAIVAIPIANEMGTLLFGAYTGAGALRRTPPDRYVINYRASYAEEVEAMIGALIDQAGLKPEEIAFFTQRDAYGDAGYAAGIDALTRRGLKNENRILHVRYERNTLAVERDVADIVLADPPVKAIILIGAYAPTAKFVSMLREFGLDPLLLSVSFVGSRAVLEELGPLAEGLITTQVVPCCDPELPILEEFTVDLAAVAPERAFSFGVLEGYVVARILIKALEQLPGMPTRETLIGALEELGEFDIGLGVPLYLSPEEHQASHTIWPTIISDGRFRPLDWNELRALEPEPGQ